MNILVVGRGWTGNKVYNELMKRGSDVTTTFVSHKDSIPYVRKNNYDWVINCAGVTGSPNVDACELKPSLTMDGNVTFPILLHRECEAKGTRFAHFSSGCIYTGQINDVDVPPNFFGSIYSISKGLSDTYLKDKALVFRIRMPFTGSNEQKNYLSKVKHYAKTKKLYDAGHNSMTDLDEAVKIACDLVLENTGNYTVNLVNQGSVTLRELAELMNLEADWYTQEEFRKNTAAGRSTCTIPAYHRMSDLKEALKLAIQRI